MRQGLPEVCIEGESDKFYLLKSEYSLELKS